MDEQIKRADYVLVVCTEVYTKRAEGREDKTLGLGANWEGGLITQAIYDDGGRNTKFIPVILNAADVKYRPRFLASSTYFNLSVESGYEDMYRLLTSQPAVIKPALGTIRKLTASSPPLRTDRQTAGEIDSFRISADKAVVIWRLPRGFLLLEGLQQKNNEGWATIAHYFDYDGNEIHGTHYHESYGWSQKYGAIDNQCAKLHIPQGDRIYAYPALNFMMDVREARLIISAEGEVTQKSVGSPIDGKLVTIHPPGPVKLPKPPNEYRASAATGALRDLMHEAEQLLLENGRPPYRADRIGELSPTVARIRREVRIELPRRLDATHPALKNVEEIILRYKPDDAANRLAWLQELVEATWEAIYCIQEQVD